MGRDFGRVIILSYYLTGQLKGNKMEKRGDITWSLLL